MALSDDDIAELTVLEESMWRGGTRYDRAWLEKVWVKDMAEFGGSGRVYTGDELMEAEGGNIPALLPLKDLTIQLVGPDTALNTYVSQLLRDGAIEQANRSSVWTRSEQGWQMRFHQGTPADTT